MVFRYYGEIANACKLIGLKEPDDFVSVDPLPFEAPGPIGEEVLWFSPHDGIAWCHTLSLFVQRNRNRFSNDQAILAGIKAFQSVFQQAMALGVSWHLEIHFSGDV